MQRIARSLGLGKWRYHKGSDLLGNNYFEIPDPNRPNAFRRTVRQPGVSNPHQYVSTNLPPLWSAWMRCTREDPPTYEEQVTEAKRQASLSVNVARLAEEYKAEKLRLAERNTLSVSNAQAQATAAVNKPAIGPAATLTSADQKREADGELSRARQHMRRSPLEDYRPAAMGKSDEPESWAPRSARR